MIMTKLPNDKNLWVKFDWYMWWLLYLFVSSCTYALSHNNYSIHYIL